MLFLSSYRMLTENQWASHPFSIAILSPKGLESIPADIGWEVGYTLDKLPAHHRAYKQRPCILTPKANLESAVYLTHIYLDCGKKPERSSSSNLTPVRWQWSSLKHT